MTTLTAPMLAFFTVESDTVEMTCQECGHTFEVSNRQTGRAKYCPECRDEAGNRQKLAHYHANFKIKNETGDPAVNLALAVIENAKYDASKGNDEAKEFLADGAELWIRACGISLRPSYLRRLRNFRIEDK